MIKISLLKYTIRLEKCEYSTDTLIQFLYNYSKNFATIKLYKCLCLFTVSLRWGLGEECPLVGGVALGLLERDIRFRPSSSADPVHVVLNMAFTPEEEPWIRLLIALTCLLRLNDALLVKESSRDLPEPVSYAHKTRFYPWMQWIYKEWSRQTD